MVVVAAVLAVSVAGASGCTKADSTQKVDALAVAKQHYESGQFEKAESELNGVLADDAQNEAALDQLALTLAAQGKNDEAVEVYAKLVEIEPADDASWYRMAMLERLLGRPKQAEAHLVKALESNPGDAGYTDELARTKMTMGEYGEAATLWGSLAKKKGLSKESRKELYSLQGQAYQEAKDYGRAKKAFKQALKLDPDDEVLVARVKAFE